MASAGSENSANEVLSGGRRQALKASRVETHALKPTLSPRLLDPIQWSMLFGLYCAGLWKWVDVRLIYHGGGEVMDFPVFYWGWGFLREHLAYPGGPVRYVSALLAQSLFHSWWGAVVLTLQASVLFWTVGVILRVIGAQRLGWVRYVPPLLVLGLYCGYGHYSVPVTTLTLSLSCVALYLRVRSTKAWIRYSVLLVCCLLLEAAAPPALLVFALLVSGIELLLRGHWSGVLLPLVLSGMAAGLEGMFVFGLAPAEVWGMLPPFGWDRRLLSSRGAGLVAASYLFLPMVVLGSLGWRAFPERVRSFVRGATAWMRRDHVSRSGNIRGSKSHGGHAKGVSQPSAPSPSSRRIGLWLVETAVLLLVTCGILRWGVDTRMKSLLSVDYSVWHRMWPEALEAAGRSPAHLYVLCGVAQASYHTGRLTSALPLVRKPADLLLFDESQHATWKKSDLWFDLGHVNNALHYLIESVEFYGERPMLLERLVVVNLALGNVSTARIYLQALTAVPFHGQWARERLARMETDPGLAGDEEVGRLGGLMPKKDSIVRMSMEETLLVLLEGNRQNRMAFEYLMTSFLLGKNLAGFATQLPRLDDFPGFELTPLWQEGIALATKGLGQHPGLKTHPPERAAWQRLTTVLEILNAAGGDKDVARSRLPTDYDQSYLAYYFFHR